MRSRQCLEGLSLVSALCGSKIFFTMGHGPQRVCHLDGQGHILREESRVITSKQTSYKSEITFYEKP